MNASISRWAAVALASTVSLAAAHEGPRVWVAQQGGQLVTLASDDDYDPATYAPSQVFAAELSPYFGVNTTQFPGYEAPRDGSGGVGNGTAVGFRIAGPLLTLDADAARLVPTSQRFAGQAAIPQLAITFPDAPPSQAAAFTRYTSGGVVDGFTFSRTIEEHAHLAYTFLGDGRAATSAGPDGVYVLPMVLTSPALRTSDWYFLAFAKTSTDAQLGQATSLAQSMARARPGDTNFDGSVAFDDLLTLARNYNTSSGAWWSRGDFDFDGAVAFADLLALARNYGSTASFAADWTLVQALVPEPALLAAALGAVGWVRRRR